ncbi:hypothetical protein D3C80_832030 [compost metagenome]
MRIGLLPGPIGKCIELHRRGRLVANSLGHDFALDDLVGHHLRVELFDLQERLRDQQSALVVHAWFYGAPQPLGLYVVDGSIAPGIELLGDTDGVFDDDCGAAGFGLVNQRCQGLS